MRLVLLLIPLCFLVRPGEAAAQDFVLPLNCSLGDVCVVQNYADADASAGSAQDPDCGPLTYDGHDGLDFRAPAALARRGVAVLAPAAGIVAGARDGEPDGVFIRDGLAALNGRDCGNGVSITHEGGWSSQLCHMRAGSVLVHSGDHVEAGQVLGVIGLSGHTQFPHVHLTLRRNGETRDPLTGQALGAAACGPTLAAGSHWSARARAGLAYRGALWFEAGFTGAAPTQGGNPEDLPASATRTAPALVFWALASGPRNGDVLRVRLYGPNGRLVAENTRTQQRNQAQAWLFAGRRTPQGGWPAGAYRGEAQILRDGRVIATRSEHISLRAD